MFDVKQHFSDRIQGGLSSYVNDLKCMSDEQLRKKVGSARSGYDFTYEIVIVNELMAHRLNGTNAEPFNPTEWVVAPEEFCETEVAITRVQESTANVLEAWNKFPIESVNEPLPTSQNGSSAIGVVNMVATHLAYHDAQLNFIQAIDGDGEVHW